MARIVGKISKPKTTEHTHYPGFSPEEALCLLEKLIPGFEGKVDTETGLCKEIWKDTQGNTVYKACPNTDLRKAILQKVGCEPSR